MKVTWSRGTISYDHIMYVCICLLSLRNYFNLCRRSFSLSSTKPRNLSRFTTSWTKSLPPPPFPPNCTRYPHSLDAKFQLNFSINHYLLLMIQVLGDWTGCRTANREMGRICRTSKRCPFCLVLCFLCEILSSHPV